MAKKLSAAETQVFDEILKEAPSSLVQLSPEKFIQRLREQQQASYSPNQLALWLSEDPLKGR